MDELLILTEEAAPYLDEARRAIAVSALPLTRAARVQSPRRPEDRARRLAAEIALRRLLKRIGEDYAALTVSYTAEGKPYFDGRPDLSFSVSHSGGLAAVALLRAMSGTAPAVGVDIQEVPRGDSAEKYTALAARFFSPSFRAALVAANESERARTFARLWCLTEAAAKATGRGSVDFARAEETLKTARSQETRLLTDTAGRLYALAVVTLDP